MYKVCWMVERENLNLKINSENGELVLYRSFAGNDILNNISFEELYKKLGFPEDYEICQENSGNANNIINYAKKYGDVYNKYESVNISMYSGKIGKITVLKYPYKDEEILISREKALEIARENNIEVDTIELSIEKICDLNMDIGSYNSIEIIEQEELNDVEIFTNSVEFRKVWRIVGNKESVLIDVNTGKVIYKK